MTNKNLLKSAMAKYNISNKLLAKEIGITPQALYLKIANKQEFKQVEIATIKNILSLSELDIVNIFFN